MTASAEIAIIITCYNYRDYVLRAIDSVTSQACGSCELVVIDDGSTDGSWDAIAATGVTAFRIDNAGQRAACLFGLAKTTAPFVLFLDADDELAPGALARILPMLDDRVAKLQFALTRIDADGVVISGPRPPLETYRSRRRIADQILKTGVYNTPPSSGNVFRRDVCAFLAEAGYDKAVDGVILFVAPFVGDIVSMSEQLGRYRIHGRNDSGLGNRPDAQKIARDMERFLARMDHLRTILQRVDGELHLVDPRRTSYFQELELCRTIALGGRPAVGPVMKLVSTLIGNPVPWRSKASVAVFFMLAALVPNERAIRLLAFRARGGTRLRGGLSGASKA